jgi:hypothetical protein
VKASAAVSASISLACYRRLGLYLLHAEATPDDDENPSNESPSVHHCLSRCHPTASKTPHPEPWCRPTSISGDRSTYPRVRVRKNLEPTRHSESFLHICQTLSNGHATSLMSISLVQACLWQTKVADTITMRFRSLEMSTFGDCSLAGM